jgi:hypothetical protein
MSIAENLSDALSTESLAMFGFCFGTIGFCVLGILLIACYNCMDNSMPDTICIDCYNYKEDVENKVLDFTLITEPGNPIILKENSAKTKWLPIKMRDNENQNKSMKIMQIASNLTKHETSV